MSYSRHQAVQFRPKFARIRAGGGGRSNRPMLADFGATHRPIPSQFRRAFGPNRHESGRFPPDLADLGRLWPNPVGLVRPDLGKRQPSFGRASAKFGGCSAQIGLPSNWARSPAEVGPKFAQIGIKLGQVRPKLPNTVEFGANFGLLRCPNDFGRIRPNLPKSNLPPHSVCLVRI